MKTPSQVELSVFELMGKNERYQTLGINLLTPQTLISVKEMLKLEFPSELNHQRGVILYGRAPMWLYSHLVEHCLDFPWVACYDIRSGGAIVVSSQVSKLEAGDVLPINFSKVPGAAILIGGPPNSGKGVLSNALRLSLAAKKPQKRVYVHRANWDGEGTYIYETPDQNLVNQLRNQNKYKIHKQPNSDQLLQDYFKYQGNATQKIRQVVDLALIDVGGMPKSEKIPLVEQCSHYIIISRYPDKIQEWHQLCGNWLKPLAIIHSVWEERFEVLQRKPFLEIIAGKWERQHIKNVPDVLLEEVFKVIEE